MPTHPMPEVPSLDALRRVKVAALSAIDTTEGSPCNDVKGCLTIVYLAGVVDALAWAAGDGPLPRSFRERAA